MADWVLKGLRTGIKTTLYPERREMTPGVTPGRPLGTFLKSAEGGNARRVLSNGGHRPQRPWRCGELRTVRPLLPLSPGRG
jgi:hypothetical protein